MVEIKIQHALVKLKELVESKTNPRKHFDPAEMRTRQANNHAPNSAIFDQQIRAATQHRERQLMFGAKLQHLCQVRFRRGLNIKIGLAADAQRCAACQRLILLE